MPSRSEESRVTSLYNLRYTDFAQIFQEFPLRACRWLSYQRQRRISANSNHSDRTASTQLASARGACIAHECSPRACNCTAHRRVRAGVEVVIHTDHVANGHGDENEDAGSGKGRTRSILLFDFHNSGMTQLSSCL